MTATGERVDLGGGSWVAVHRAWLPADEARSLYEGPRAGVAWRQGRLWRYDHWVTEPRLGGSSRPGRPLPAEGVDEVHRAARSTCERRFEGIGMAWYRDGSDTLAFHRDRDLRWLDETVIAVLTLGARRPFLLRPRANRYDHESLAWQGATHDLAPAAGDLLVMGGRCQADWEHAVPKAGPGVGGRISLQWCWTSGRGRPVQGPSYRAPRTYARSR